MGLTAFSEFVNDNWLAPWIIE